LSFLAKPSFWFAEMNSGLCASSLCIVSMLLLNFSPWSFFRLCIIVLLYYCTSLILMITVSIINRMKVLVLVCFGTVLILDMPLKSLVSQLKTQTPKQVATGTCLAHMKSPHMNPSGAAIQAVPGLTS